MNLDSGATDHAEADVANISVETTLPPIERLFQR
jgi:hypothetical protein